MRTGDVLHIDSGGYLYLTGRKKELIKYKGFQVAPSELEGILTSHPLVEEGAVCAKWDADNGTEIPIAFVTLRDTAHGRSGRRQMLGRDIRDFVDSRVSPYKKLRGGVEIVDEMPKTASGKVLKRVLQEGLIARARL